MAEKFDIEEYIKDLSPELQEKARECSTPDELIQLAAEEDVEIPMEALENVAGGGCGRTMEYFCRSCGSTDIFIEDDDYEGVPRCSHCNSKNIAIREVKEE